MEHVQPDVQEQHEDHHLDRPAQQLQQKIIQLGLGAGGQPFEPGEGDHVNQLGDIKRQQDVDQRGGIFPKRFAEKRPFAQGRDLIQPKGHVMFVQLFNVPDEGGRLVGSRRRRRWVCRCLSGSPNAPRQRE